MAILDHRLTLTEDRLSSIVSHQRGLTSVPAHTVSAHRQQDAGVSYSYQDDEESDGGESASGGSGEDHVAESEEAFDSDDCNSEN